MSAASLVTFALGWCATGALVLGSTLRTGSEPVRLARACPWFFARVLLVVWGVVPVLGFATVAALDLRGIPAACILLTAITPGVPLLVSSSRSVTPRAEAQAIASLTLIAATAPLFVPLWIRVVAAMFELSVVTSPLALAAALAPSIYLPMLVGALVRRRWSRHAERLARGCDVLFGVGTVASLAIVLVRGAPLLASVPVRAFGAVVAFTTASALVGYAVGGPHASDRRVAALATSLSNPALALAIVATSWPGFRAEAIACAYLIVRTLSLQPALLWLRRGKDGDPGTHHGARDPGPGGGCLPRDPAVPSMERGLAHSLLSAGAGGTR